MRDLCKWETSGHPNEEKLYFQTQNQALKIELQEADGWRWS